MDTLEVVPTGLGALPVADPLSVEAHVPLATPVLQGLVDPIGALVDDVASVHLGGGPIDAVPLATPNFVEDIANPGDDSGTSAPAAEDHRGKLFIGGLSWETTVDGLRAYFEKYGEVTDCVVMSNAHTGRSRGFGFITFSDPAVAKHVIENGPHTLDNREIDPKPAVPKGGAPGRKNKPRTHSDNKARGRQNQQQNQTAIKTKKIFVGGLAPESNEESLKEFFGTHGTVEDVILMYDRETKRPRGFGFVTFSSEEPVDKLVALRYVELNDKQVEIKAALPKSTIGEGNRRNNRNNFSGNNSRSGSQSQSQGQFPYPYGGGYNANYQQGFQQGYGRPGQPGQFQQGQYAGYPQNYGQGNAQSQAAQAAAYSQAAQYYEYNARANAGYQMEHGMQQQQYQQGGAEGQQNYDNMMAQGQGQNGQSQYYSTFGQGQQPGSGRPAGPAVAMQSKTAQAAASNAAIKERKEAPGDSAGGPSASPLPGDMSSQGVAEGFVHEPSAEKQMSVETATLPPSAEGDSSRAAPPSSVAAADSGGGYVVDPHNSSQVRFEDQSNGFGFASLDANTHDTPRTPAHAGAINTPAAVDVDNDAPQPLVISPDATLMDGLRALLVHHLKRSVGSNVVSLSASQAELLEHHLARLASYAQKIVHTLAFATRFLSKQADSGEAAAHPHNEPHFGGAGGVPHHHPQFQQHGQGNGGYGADGGAPPVQQEPRAPRKSLKLSDDEILNIYRSAQAEAAIEADWRGIEGPAVVRPGWSEREGTNRSGTSAPQQPGGGAQDAQGGDHEYLRMLSRALQEPGRSPRALTAEILDPSTGAVCCQPMGNRVPHMMNGGQPSGAAGLPPSSLQGSPSASSSQRNGGAATAGSQRNGRPHP